MSMLLALYLCSKACSGFLFSVPQYLKNLIWHSRLKYSFLKANFHSPTATTLRMADICIRPVFPAPLASTNALDTCVLCSSVPPTWGTLLPSILLTSAALPGAGLPILPPPSSSWAHTSVLLCDASRLSFCVVMLY